MVIRPASTRVVPRRRIFTSPCKEEIVKGGEEGVREGEEGDRRGEREREREKGRGRKRGERKWG